MFDLSNFRTGEISSEDGHASRYRGEFHLIEEQPCLPPLAFFHAVIADWDLLISYFITSAPPMCKQPMSPERQVRSLILTCTPPLTPILDVRIHVSLIQHPKSVFLLLPLYYRILILITLTIKPGCWSCVINHSYSHELEELWEVYGGSICRMNQQRHLMGQQHQSEFTVAKCPWSAVNLALYWPADNKLPRQTWLVIRDGQCIHWIKIEDCYAYIIPSPTLAFSGCSLCACRIVYVTLFSYAHRFYSCGGCGAVCIMYQQMALNPKWATPLFFYEWHWQNICNVPPKMTDTESAVCCLQSHSHTWTTLQVMWQMQIILGQLVIQWSFQIWHTNSLWLQCTFVRLTTRVAFSFSCCPWE